MAFKSLQPQILFLPGFLWVTPSSASWIELKLAAMEQNGDAAVGEASEPEMTTKQVINRLDHEKQDEAVQAALRLMGLRQLSETWEERLGWLISLTRLGTSRWSESPTASCSGRCISAGRLVRPRR